METRLEQLNFSSEKLSKKARLMLFCQNSPEMGWMPPILVAGIGDGYLGGKYGSWPRIAAIFRKYNLAHAPLFIVSEFHVRHGKSLQIRRSGGYKCGDELCTIFAALGENIFVMLKN